MLVNQKELSAVLGITTRRIRQLVDEYGFFSFVEGEKKYNLAKCVKEYIEYRTQLVTGAENNLDKEKESAEKIKVQREILEYKLRHIKGETHEAKFVEKHISNMLIDFKNKVLAVPQKVAVQLVSEEDINTIIKVLKDEMYETLEVLSEYDPTDLKEEMKSVYEDDIEDDINEDEVVEESD
jgi:hypothetical protein